MILCTDVCTDKFEHSFPPIFMGGLIKLVKKFTQICLAKIQISKPVLDIGGVDGVDVFSLLVPLLFLQCQESAFSSRQ